MAKRIIPMILGLISEPNLQSGLGSGLIPGQGQVQEIHADRVKEGEGETVMGGRR